MPVKYLGYFAANDMMFSTDGGKTELMMWFSTDMIF